MARDQSSAQEADRTSQIIDLVKQFMALTEERAKILPYKINLIETLGGAIETENSKILAAFLRYQTPTGQFEILESLIHYINSRYNTLSDIKVEKPIIDTEYCNIDIYIREFGEYAIIMENKSNWAIDQNQQLSRYIETVRCIPFEYNQIFVLYLPPLDGKDPEDQSWGGFKKQFESRYAKISWRNDILPWMREKVLPNVRMKDIPLSSALEQYIDYWEGQFGLRGVDNAEKMKMEDAVIKSLSLESPKEDGESLRVISNAYHNSDLLTQTLKALGNERKSHIEFQFWNHMIAAFRRMEGYRVEQIHASETEILTKYCGGKSQEIGIRVFFTAKERIFRFDCYEAEDGNGFCGFRFMNETDPSTDDAKPTQHRNPLSKCLEEIAKRTLPKPAQWPSWYGVISSVHFSFRSMSFATIVERLGTNAKCQDNAQKWANIFHGYITKFQDQVNTENAIPTLKLTESQS